MYKGQKITVIIPCLNEEKGIEKILKGMPEFVDETIVVDNNSTDRTPEIALSLGAKVIREEVRGYGRNADDKDNPEKNNPTPTPSAVPVAELRRAERHLTDRFGSRVQVRPGPKGNGEIKIAFDSVEDMQRILHILQPS